MEATFKKEAASGPRIDTDRECITKKDANSRSTASDARGLHAFRRHDDAHDTGNTAVVRRRAQGLRRVPHHDADAGDDDRRARPELGDGKDVMTIKSQLKDAGSGRTAATRTTTERTAADEDEREEEE